MISDLNKVNIDELQIPSLEKLQQVCRISDDEIFSLIRILSKEDNYFSSYLSVSARNISRIVLFFSSSKPIFLNEILRIKRTYLEIFIDLVWIYKHSLEDKDLGEKLAKRFFQIGANNFVDGSKDLKEIVENDIFLRKIKGKLSIEDDIKVAKNKNLITLYDPSHPNEVIGIQKIKWQAIPELFNSKKEIRKKLTFKGKVKEVIPLAKNLFNHKNPAYMRDYKNLNYFTHWSAFHYMDLEKELEQMIYIRELNFCICYLHDTLNLLYDYLGISVPERIATLRQEFIYLS